MKCPKCNAEIDSGERFCGECGQALPTVPSQPQTPVPTPEAAAQRRRWPYALKALIGVAVFGWLWLLRMLGLFGVFFEILIVGIAFLVGLGFVGQQFFRGQKPEERSPGELVGLVIVGIAFLVGLVIIMIGFMEELFGPYYW
jgi:hypothetical protein